MAFDRTYEGLKPCACWSGTPPAGPFDRTYEGLKLGPRIGSDKDPVSF